MPSEILQFLISTVLIAIYFVLLWLVTRFYKPQSLEIEFAAPWKDAALSIGYVIGLFLVIGVVFFFLEGVAGVPIGISRARALSRRLWCPQKIRCTYYSFMRVVLPGVTYVSS